MWRSCGDFLVWTSIVANDSSLDSALETLTRYISCISLIHSWWLIIYFGLSGLVKLRQLVRSPKIRDIEISLRQADPNSYRQVLSEMKSKEIQNLIVDTKPEHMHHFLRMVNHSLHSHSRDMDSIYNFYLNYF